MKCSLSDVFWLMIAYFAITIGVVFIASGIVWVISK